MPTLRNISGTTRDIPALGQVGIEPGATFEADDAVAESLAAQTANFELVKTRTKE